MDFGIIVGRHDYRDIDESDSESDNDGPDLEAPRSRDASPYLDIPLPPHPLPRNRSPSPSSSKDLPKKTAKKKKEKDPQKANHSIGARIQALTLLAYGKPKWTLEKIRDQTGIAKTTLYDLKAKAMSRGWDPTAGGKTLKTWHVDDEVRSGRPPIDDKVVQLIVDTVTKNSTTRGWLCARIAQEVNKVSFKEAVSPSTVYRTLKKQGYSVFKKTVKPGLTKAQMAERLKWCKAHAWMTLEDWKYVIFSDETSVQLGGVRGKRRVWRKDDEAFHDHCIVRRWKGNSKFMWWSCFCWFEKGPYHIWSPETAAEKK